jgi:heme exporter protein B
MGAVIWAILRRDLALSWSAGGAAYAPIGFFLAVTTLLPLSIGPERGLLAMVGPALVWVMAALSALMTLERVFQADLEDGSLDQALLSQAPLELVVAAKGLAQWLAVGLPLALAGAPIALMLQTPPLATLSVAAGLGIGMVGFVGIGLLGAALAAGVRRGGLLIAVIVLPFFAPLIVFGAAAALAAAAGELFGPAFAFLAGLALFFGTAGPLAAAAALKVQAE